MLLLFLNPQRPLIVPVKDELKEFRPKVYKTKIPPHIKPLEIKPEKIELYRQSDPTTFSNKEFKTWFTWWQTNLSTEDYYKYISTQVKKKRNCCFKKVCGNQFF